MLDHFWKRALIYIVLMIGLGGIIFVGITQTIKLDAAWMPWNYSVWKFGYGVCFVEDIEQWVNPIKKPDGYDENYLKDYMETDSKDVIASEIDNNRTQPDIILILNETFCDLDDIAYIDSDKEYLSDFYGIDGAAYGHVVVPSEGGGTNNSEYELLMSKSMFLMNLEAPFTYLDSDVLERNVVSYLKKLGYETVAMHCADGENYSRNVAYPAMGFDHILFEEGFTEAGCNGNRKVLDSNNYEDMINVYNSLNINNPRFIYLLTFQNHGGYEQNPDELDTIHTTRDYGSLTDDINEYLSSIKLSGEAFQQLTDYYAKNEREVIICLVGDHAPAFISDVQVRDDVAILDWTINKRTVPYVIWTNFDADIENFNEYASMVDLVPMVLREAGLPLSEYYRNLLDLHEKLPIRTSEGRYVDKDGNINVYEAKSKYYDLLNRYYYMEYNSLLGEEEYLDSIFEIKK